MRSANEPTTPLFDSTPVKPLEGAAGAQRAGEPDADSDGLADAHAALESALEKKALEPVLLDVRGLCSYTNYLLLVSGRSDRQVEAICDGVLTTMRERGVRPLGVEGKSSGQWALLDFGDVIVHVFHHPLREHYDLEGLWIEATKVPIDVPDEARVTDDELY